MQAAVVLQLITAQETHRVVLANVARQRFGLNRNAKFPRSGRPKMRGWSMLNESWADLWS
jgi:hypothetical protein